jgi:hypothetical protein
MLKTVIILFIIQSYLSSKSVLIELSIFLDYCSNSSSRGIDTSSVQSGPTSFPVSLSDDEDRSSFRKVLFEKTQTMTMGNVQNNYHVCDNTISSIICRLNSTLLFTNTPDYNDQVTFHISWTFHEAKINIKKLTVCVILADNGLSSPYKSETVKLMATNYSCVIVKSRSTVLIVEIL